eukprot:TRINITY_DN10572_c0_g1_i5.p1 TRINITY_DN10572_c0_g1~~TRINITY_DN10572_c0_g1_i5.p1  ORF type:complete len:474 (+),score=113.42 TRINITY_DN10572_c0_g1_i5:134-1555(+)
MDCLNHRMTSAQKLAALSEMAFPRLGEPLQTKLLGGDPIPTAEIKMMTASQFKRWAVGLVNLASDDMVLRFCAEMSNPDRQHILLHRQKVPLERRLLADVAFNLISADPPVSANPGLQGGDPFCQRELSQDVMAEVFAELTGVDPGDVLRSVKEVVGASMAREESVMRPMRASAPKLPRLRLCHFQEWCAVFFQDLDEPLFRRGFLDLIQRHKHKAPTTAGRELSWERDKMARAVFASFGLSAIPLELFGCVAERMQECLTPTVLLAHFNERASPAAKATSPGSGEVDEEKFCQFVGWRFGKSPQFEEKLEWLATETRAALAQTELEEESACTPHPVEFQKTWLQQAYRVKGLRRLYSMRGVDISPSEMEDPGSSMDEFVTAVTNAGRDELTKVLTELADSNDGPRTDEFWVAAAEIFNEIGIDLTRTGPYLTPAHVVGWEHDWSLAVLHACSGTKALLSLDGDAPGYSVVYM